MRKALITKIQRFSIHDGPGIRTTAFFKGCPLRCLWCHNPETQSGGFEAMHDAQACIACRSCAEACDKGAAFWIGRPRLDPAKCDGCRRCEEACPAGALVISGEEYSPEELMEQMLRDRAFFDETGGGLTFSGGEPLTRADFLEQCLSICRREGIHCAVDTSGHVPRGAFERVLNSTDLFLFDLKSADSAKHRALTGVPNEQIIDNLRFLTGRGAALEVRMPLVSGVNDTDRDVREALKLFNDIGVGRVRLLPYHGMGAYKYERLGLEYAIHGAEPPTAKRIGRIADMLRESGATVIYG